MLKKIWKAAKHRYLLSIALLGAGVALGLDLAGLDRLSHVLLTIVLVGELIPLLYGMIRDIRVGTYGVDILAATAIVVAVVMQEYWAAMVIALMLTGGEALEDYAEHRARRELDALLSQAPQKARILRGRKEVEVRASEVRPGDKIVVRPGEVVPVDATILEGSASFDESSLTGESLPEVKKPGDNMVSGSINLDGAIVARALHSAADSQYEQIIKLVRNAARSKAPFVRLADRYAIPFTIIALGIAGVAWAASGESIRFLQVLVVATPCPLILAAPIAIISGMSRAAKQGIIIKNGSALEQLAEVRTFAFDKTGTLTQGMPVVDQVKAYNGFTPEQLLGMAAALELNSNHVLAKAIIAKAEKAGAKFTKAKNVRELSGNGLEAMVSGKKVFVGRLGFLQDYDVALPKQFDADKVQSTAAFVAINAQLAGVITFKDEVRAEAKETLGALRKLGVRDILMVTGDNLSTAKRVARGLGIKSFRAEALPGDKIHAIEEAKERPVAFVGDGVNDAPVLTAANLGIALGARGSTAASESADIVIMKDNLHLVAESREIAHRTFFIAKQSILVGIGLSVLLMLIFATSKFKPIYGAAIQEIVDVIVIFNALRAHGSGQKKPTAS
jgi:heavy metal translocating P-type ATPase